MLTVLLERLIMLTVLLEETNNADCAARGD